MGTSLIGIVAIVSALLPSFVRVGDSGNQSSPNGKGRVDYEYEISATELNNDEYCLFLNSVARDSDIYNLFVPVMQSHFMGGIIREKDDDGRFTYVVKPGYNNLPVSGLPWIAAARYCNWLHYNSANIENQVPIESYYKLTEGDTRHGVYNTTSQDLTSITRNPGARYWIPNQNEWLKAAYFDGSKWTTDIIYNGSNIYDRQTGWAVPYPHLKPVGENTSPSHYGTYDQQGNVAEWVEDRNGKTRLSLGGSLIRPIAFAKFGATEGDFADKPVASFGLRICREPSSSVRREAVKLFTGNASPHEQEVVSSNVFLTDPNGGNYVVIDHKGNPGDAVNRFKGSVGYDYAIARCELTNSEYCRFLNAVADIEDTYSLYDHNMADGVTGGIDKDKKDGKYVYTVKNGYANRPVTYIGFYELARYANWLHYGCPGGRQILGVTEGNKSTGAYDTSDFESVRSGEKKVYEAFGKRNSGAKYWIPNENEWYKAAYFDPTIFGHRKYHDYPTRTSMPPSSEQANYMVGDRLSAGEPYFVSEVDDYAESASYFGTLNQGGNVWEWTESWQYGIPGQRALRGGSWQYTEQGLNAENEDPGGINDKSYLFGGRLCRSIEEEGFVEVKTPFLERVYQWLMIRPQKHLLGGLALLLLLSCVGLFIIVKYTTVSICGYLKKKQKKS